MKNIFKKWYVWVFLFFLVIIIIPGSDNPQTSEQAQVQPTPAPIETQKVESSVDNPRTESTTTVPTPEQSKPKTVTSTPTATATKPEPAKPVQVSYKVTSVVDGDTIKISMNGEIETLRLIGMDTPETVDPRKPVQCFGKEASAKGKELLLNKTVRIEADSTQDTRDKYGRLLVYVYRDDGLFYNQHMIEEGYAHEYTYQTAYKFQKEFKAAQQSAKSSGKGLWSPTTCNGDTTSSSTTTTTTTSTTPSSTGKYYTSSHYSAKYYYPESCDGWKSLSPSYLKSFNSVEELLKIYPSKTESPSC